MDKIKRDKKELRKQILQKRSEFPGDVIIRNSNVIIDVESGTMGVLEPKLDKFRFVDPSEIDFFVVPWLAFDISRNRLILANKPVTV